MSTRYMILIDGSLNEELRVANVRSKIPYHINNNHVLYNLDIERPGHKQKKASIYKARVTHVEASLEAAFVDYGAERHGFLPLKEVASVYHHPSYRPNDENCDIKYMLREGQDILVQVEKEERGNKGAALTTYITLAGCYLVLMPNNPAAGGISRRIEGDERSELREIINNLKVPEDIGLIVRTAGEGRTQEELTWDLNVLLRQWEEISKAFDNTPSPALIYQESDVIIRTIRDYFRDDISEIIISDEQVYQKAVDHVKRVRPQYLERVKHYQHRVPLFSRYQIESQIESAFQREVRLPSGGAIVIDHTEAMVSIDINSSKATKGGDIEETALQTNLEAAEEVARQLRLRDIGGLIVIDFIDMTPTRNQREVEMCLREALKADRARVQVGRISRFGLLEMSRQRLRASIGEAIQTACPRCHGQGTIRSIRSLSMSIVRLIEENAVKHGIVQIQIQVPLDLATYLLNEKRQVITAIEQRTNVNVVIVPNPNLQSPDYRIKRIHRDDMRGRGKSSYDLRESSEQDLVSAAYASGSEAPHEAPAAAHSVSSSYAADGTDSAPKQPQKGVLKRLFSGLLGRGEPKKQPASTAKRRPNQRRKQNNYQQQNRRKTSDNRYRKQGNRGGNNNNKRQQGKHSDNQNRRYRSQYNRNRNNDNRRNDNQKRNQENQPLENKSEQALEVIEQNQNQTSQTQEKKKQQRHHDSRRRRPAHDKQKQQQSKPHQDEDRGSGSSDGSSGGSGNMALPPQTVKTPADVDGNRKDYDENRSRSSQNQRNKKGHKHRSKASKDQDVVYSSNKSELTTSAGSTKAAKSKQHSRRRRGHLRSHLKQDN